MHNIVSFICIFLCVATVSSKNIYRGVATDTWGGCEDLNLLSRMSWYYNWALTPTPNIQSCALGGRYIEFVPMIHKGSDVTPDVVSRLPPGTNYLMAFNEPNFSSQANLSPAEAATLWLQVEQQLANAGLLGKIKLGAPSASPGGDLMSPQQWFKWFFGNCSACHFDFLNFHIYDCNLPYFDDGALNYWLSVASSYGLPIWLTEFDCPFPPNASIEVEWMRKALASLDSNPNVTRYAWFTARATNVGTIPSLLTDTIPTTLTPIGIFYNSAGDLLSSSPPTSTGTTSTESSSSSSNTGTANTNTGTATSKTTATNTGSKSSGGSTSSTTSFGSSTKSGSTSKSTSTQSSSSSTQSSISSSNSRSSSKLSSSSYSSSSSSDINNSNFLHPILIGAMVAILLLL